MWSLLAKFIVLSSSLLGSNINADETDLMSCVCFNCDEKLTVGIMLNGNCFYIYINDRIFTNNNNVKQLNDLMNPKLDRDSIDGIAALLSAEFYIKFRYPKINLNIRNSSFFKITHDQYPGPVFTKDHFYKIKLK